MPLIVRFRPNGAYLSLVAIGAAVIATGALWSGVFRGALIGSGGVLIMLLGYPAAASTVLRVPVLVVGPDGIRLPMMGVRLGWSEIAEVRPAVRMSRRPARSSRATSGGTLIPVLLVVPTDSEATIRQMHWWLRIDARRELASLGSPIVLDDRPLNHTLDEIRSAVITHTPSA